MKKLNLIKDKLEIFCNKIATIIYNGNYRVTDVFISSLGVHFTATWYGPDQKITLLTFLLTQLNWQSNPKKSQTILLKKRKEIEELKKNEEKRTVLGKITAEERKLLGI